jgi:Zinc dependent phospholipase C
LPKENTHIYLANRIIETIPCDTTRGLMRANYDFLCLGSVVADTFFYSSCSEVMEISERLHGKEGEKTNELAFHLLELAMNDRSESLLSLALGYISHCVFDMIFHPVIYYLAGNYYDDDPSKRDSAVYEHRLLETRLDVHLNDRFHIHNILREDDTNHHEVMGIFAAKYNVEKEELIRAYRKQLRGNRHFKSQFTYKLIYLLNKYKIKKYEQILPLFYGHLQRDFRELKLTFEIRDIIDGRTMRWSLDELLESAREEGIRRIETAVDYFYGRIDKIAAMEVIRGESLDTGREDCPVNSINHTE